MSQTVSSRPLCLTRSTLKTGGWIVVTVVYTSKRSRVVFFFPASSRLAITIFNCRTRQLRLSETPQLCLRSNGSGVHGER